MMVVRPTGDAPPGRLYAVKGRLEITLAVQQALLAGDAVEVAVGEVGDEGEGEGDAGQDAEELGV
jgi:hypothetical protein